MREELLDALDSAVAADEIHCVMVHGEHQGFSAGADLKSDELRREDGEVLDLGEYFRRTYRRTIMKKIAAVKKPVAPRFTARYTTWGVALACDLRVAAGSAKFSVACRLRRADELEGSPLLKVSDTG